MSGARARALLVDPTQSQTQMYSLSLSLVSSALDSDDGLISVVPVDDKSRLDAYQLLVDRYERVRCGYEDDATTCRLAVDCFVALVVDMNRSFDRQQNTVSDYLIPMKSSRYR